MSTSLIALKIPLLCLDSPGLKSQYSMPQPFMCQLLWTFPIITLTFRDFLCVFARSDESVAFSLCFMAVVPIWAAR